MLNTKRLGIEAAEFTARLNGQGVKAGVYGRFIVRFVTHSGIERGHVEYTLDSVRKLFGVDAKT